jgi:hypothetical protein
MRVRDSADSIGADNEMQRMLHPDSSPLFFLRDVLLALSAVMPALSRASTSSNAWS